MNLTQLLFEVGEIGVGDQRADLHYRTFINRAQRSICERRNWTFMHGLIEVTMAAGATSANLPSTFKEAAEENSPLSYLGSNGLPVPVELTTRAKVNRSRAGQYPYSFAGQPVVYAFIEQNSGGLWTLNLPAQQAAETAMTFTLSAFSYMADLALGSDHNALTDHGDLGDALVNKAKAIAYGIRPEGAACEALFQKQYTAATYTDAHKALGGRSTRW